MGTREAEIHRRLLSIFRIEAEEHLRTLAAGLLELESGTVRDETLELVFREMHSLKGAARAVSMQDLERIAHGAEELLSAMRRRRVPAGPAALAALNAVVDAMLRQLPALGGGGGGGGGGRAPTLPVAALQRRIDSAMQSAQLDAEASSPPADAVISEASSSAAGDCAAESDCVSPPPTAVAYVRVAGETLDALWAGAEGFVSARLAAVHRVHELGQLRDLVASWRKLRGRGPSSRRSAPQVAARPEANLARLASTPAEQREQFAAEAEIRLKDFESRLGALYQSAQADLRNLSTLIDELRTGMKESLMQPISLLLDGLPGLIRELAGAETKLVRLVSQGGELKVDRRVVDGLRTPLMHLLRNAVHHGIESTGARRAAGKNEQGTVRVLASPGESGTLELLVEDDGAGIARAAVLAAGQKAQAAQPMTQDHGAHALSMIFESGVSTSHSVGQISGRGLGLAIAREKIEQLGGSISVQSEPGTGTRFRIRVPVTLANFRGLLVRVAGRPFVLPLAQVRQCVRVDEASVSRLEGRVTIHWMQQVLSVHALAGLLDLPVSVRPIGPARPCRLLVLIEAAELSTLALEVDEVVAEQEVVLQLLSWPLQRVPHVMGATLLGDGQWVPVLQPADLVRSAHSARVSPAVPATRSQDSPASPIVLVVEDSYTARAMLQAVLETSGYRVLTAVDGLDALDRLGSAEIDVLVSDVEMPRLDGFELTRQVRSMPALQHLPIILVTALESAEQRARGLEVGANAYLVKSSFDDRNLLDAVAALL